jgi:hypothetical protein
MSNTQRTKKGKQKPTTDVEETRTIEKEELQVETDTREYDAILDEIDDMLADKEEVQHYTQLSGQ